MEAMRRSPPALSACRMVSSSAAISASGAHMERAASHVAAAVEPALVGAWAAAEATMLGADMLAACASVGSRLIGLLTAGIRCPSLLLAGRVSFVHGRLA